MEKEKEDNTSKSTEIPFIEELKYEEAELCYSQYEYEAAFKILLPLANNNNVKAQNLLCEIMYEISYQEHERYTVNDIESMQQYKEEIATFENLDEGWVYFIMHCFFYANNDNQKGREYLTKSLQKEERGLSYLRLGIFYEYDIQDNPNTDLALRCYDKAVELGCKQAYSYIGRHYQDTKNIEKVILYYRKGIEVGDYLSYEYLVKYYLLLQNNHEINKDNAYNIDIKSFDLFDKPQSLYNIPNPKSLYYLEKAESIVLEMFEKNIKNAYYNYGLVYLYKYWYTNIQKYADKAIFHLDLAIKHQQYQAYGELALYYMYSGDKEKAKEYAKCGEKAKDTLSRLALIEIERKEKKFDEAWNLAMCLINDNGCGSKELSKLYINDRYRPQNFDIQHLLELLKKGLYNNSYNNSKEAYDLIVTLFSSDKIKTFDNEYRNKIRLIAANRGVQQAMVDLGKSIINLESDGFSITKGCKYLELAIKKGNYKAANILLTFRSKEDNYSINELRNTVIRNNAFIYNDAFFELLFPVKLDNDNVTAYKIFMEVVAYNYDRIFCERSRIKAQAKLLINHFNNVWTLSDEDKNVLINDAKKLTEGNTNHFIYYQTIWKEVFPDFNINKPELSDDWIRIYSSIFESSEKEAELEFDNENTKHYHKNFQNFKKLLTCFYEKYIKYSQGESIPHYIESLDNGITIKEYKNIKNKLVTTYLNILVLSNLTNFTGLFIEADNVNKLFLINKLTDKNVSELLKVYLKVRIEFEKFLV